MFRNFDEGELLLVDKPKGWTSFDVVAKLRGAIRIKKIGHAGTLDPLATGLLILCTGKWTKKIDSYQAEEKEYEGTINFSSTTPTYDSESEPDVLFEYQHLSAEQIREAATGFSGMIEQYPPVYSAVKIKGQRAYELARKGKEVEMKPRQVEIKEFEITRVELPEVDFRVVCSKGTYIRSLAHDLGKKLGGGAHLSRLVRTRIGEFHLREARSLEALLEQIKKEREA